MKNSKSVAILSILLGALFQGCGHLDTPFSPASSSPVASAATMTAPSYVGSFNVGQDATNTYAAGIAYDPTQNVLYVTDADMNLVYKYSVGGQLLAQWGATLDQPQGIAVHNGNVYVADSGNARIVEYDGNGNVVTTLQPTNGAYYLFIYPTGVFLDGQGNLYVADNSDTIYRFDTTMTLTGQFTGNGQLDFPANAAEDPNGNIFVANYNTDQVLKLQSSGALISSWGQQGSANGQFNGPNDVKVDSKGNVYVADSLNDRVQTFDTNGNFLAQWGAAQGLSEPNAMTFDTSDNLYVIDSGNSRVVKYSAN